MFNIEHEINNLWTDGERLVDIERILKNKIDQIKNRITLKYIQDVARVSNSNFETEELRRTKLSKEKSKNT